MTSMQRVRIGLTGLAFVFLLVLLGTAISNGGRDGASNRDEASAEGQPNEPLAELGVAPGQVEDANSANAVD